MAAMKYAITLVIFAAGLTLATGCGSDADSTQQNTGDAGQSDTTQTDTTQQDAGDAALAPPWDASEPLGGDRPARVILPDAYDRTQSWPLVVLLHGYTATGPLQDAYFGLSRRGDERGFITVLPNGTQDGAGNRFWNATDACCNFGGSSVDDVQYLSDLLAEAKERLAVDADRVYFMGHSNGGFMSYRMACELGSEIAAIASLAGSAFDDAQDCAENGQVGVLQIHGDADETVLYDGGEFAGNAYPGAREVAERWAARNGCDAQAQTGEAADLDKDVDGAESDVEQWGGCEADRRVELWSIRGGGHIPSLSDDFTDRVLDFLFAHSRE
jgi:polyhydroxybutyrate depolymerase